MNTFEQCCEYLGIDNTLPTCQIDEKKFQATYKLRVCMAAWNKQDGFVPDEIANNDHGKDGYTPYFHFRDGRLLSSGRAIFCSYVGVVYADVNTKLYSNIGLRLPLKTLKRASEFGEIFIDIFNELI